MLVPLPVDKADMVCLIVASGIPCWPVALSLKIEWVDTGYPCLLKHLLVLLPLIKDIAVRNYGHVSPFPQMLDTSLSVSSILGLVVFFTPVSQSLLVIPKMAGLLEEMYS